MICLILVMLAMSLQVSADSKFKCPADKIDNFDVVSARILSFDEHQRKFVGTKAEIPKYCNDTKQDISTTGDIIQKCFTGTAKQFAAIILYSIKKTTNLYCSARGKKRHDSLLAMGQCVNKNEKQMHKCLSVYIDSLHRGKWAEIPAMRLGYACCDYYKLLTCMENVTKQSCSLKATNSIQEFVRNLFQSIIDVACGNYIENSDSCDKLKAPPKRKESDKETRTFFLPLVNLYNNL